MWKNTAISLILSIFFVSFCGTPIFAGGPDYESGYYTDSDDQTTEWSITISSLALVKDDETEVPVVTSNSTVNIDDPAVAAGQTAGYFAQDVQIDPGTYTHVHLVQVSTNYFNGCVQIGDDTWRATGQGDTSYDTKASALAAATRIEWSYVEESDELLALESAVTVEEGQSYTLQILWKSWGRVATVPEEGEPEGEWLGVGLMWSESNDGFYGGTLNETYTLVPSS